MPLSVVEDLGDLVERAIQEVLKDHSEKEYRRVIVIAESFDSDPMLYYARHSQESLVFGLSKILSIILRGDYHPESFNADAPEED